MPNQDDLSFLEKIKSIFKKQPPVKENDIGVYHYIWSCDTFKEESHGLKYDVFVKLKAVEVYDTLVEVEVINIKINDSASQDIINLITHTFPHYIKPKYVNWEIKS
jgi:hypothetical protein